MGGIVFIAGPHPWIPAPYRVRGRLFAGMTELCKGLRRREPIPGCWIPVYTETSAASVEEVPQRLDEPGRVVARHQVPRVLDDRQLAVPQAPHGLLRDLLGQHLAVRSAHHEGRALDPLDVAPLPLDESRPGCGRDGDRSTLSYFQVHLPLGSRFRL